MKNFLTGLGKVVTKFTSRKFLLTVGGIIAVTQFPEQQNQIIGLIASYNAAEGAADVVGRYAEIKGDKYNETIQNVTSTFEGDEYTDEVQAGFDSDIQM